MNKQLCSTNNLFVWPKGSVENQETEKHLIFAFERYIQ